MLFYPNETNSVFFSEKTMINCLLFFSFFLQKKVESLISKHRESTILHRSTVWTKMWVCQLSQHPNFQPSGIFQHPSFRKTSKKSEGSHWGIFSKKVSMPKKNWKWGPFSLARYCMLCGKTGKTFLVQFARPNGAIIFCRTFKNYFGQFVWIEKKVTIIVAFHFMKRGLKMN